MSLVQGNALGGAASYEIAKSVRFRSAASAYMQRTYGAPTNNVVYTYSMWVKRGTIGAVLHALIANTSVNDTLHFHHTQADKFVAGVGGSAVVIGTPVYRDPAAWMHVVVRQNGASSFSVYVNNALHVSYGGTIRLNESGHVIGFSNNGQYFDGYLANIHFVDGQALLPTDFAQADSQTGAWVPKAYSGTYGANGYYLKFNDGSNLTNLCLDRSGNGNNFTATNVSLTAGATYDWMDDTPTNNFCVLNPIWSGTPPSYGNLRHASGTQYGMNGTWLMTTGKWYWEVTYTALNSVYPICGIFKGGSNYIGYTGQNTEGFGIANNGTTYYNAGNPNTGLASIAAGQIAQFAYDADTGKLWIGVQGTWQASGNPAAGTSPITTVAWASSGSYPQITGFSTGVADINFGQRPFTYTPPTGFKALCTKNLTDPVIKNPSQHFQTVLAAGASIKATAEAVFASAFFEWIKDRVNATNHQLIDNVRGNTSVLISNSTATPTTYSTPTGNSVAWVWKSGGATVANNSGTRPSQVSANTTAGFSIVTYTGNGVAGATVGHGLGVAPKFIFVKNTSVTNGNWVVAHANLASPDYFLVLNLANAQQNSGSGNVWNNTAPTASVFTLGTDVSINANTNNYIAYCFTEIPGYSKMGSYTGNGLAGGPFVHCGFKPRWVLIKDIGVANYWCIFDTAREPFNVTDGAAYPNAATSDAFNYETIDVVSNGFKPRNAYGTVNTGSDTYIYVAFAENPFKYATAR